VADRVMPAVVNVNVKSKRGPAASEAPERPEMEERFKEFFGQEFFDFLQFCQGGVTFGAPFEAVTPTKQRRLRTLALSWLAEHPEHRAPELRFDVASVLAEPGKAPVIDVLEAAF
jgi:S1-C subfamily serine protease